MNRIAEIIKEKETEAFKFTPNQEFYKKVEINQKRWGQLFRAEKEPTASEMLRIAKYFQVSINDLINE